MRLGSQEGILTLCDKISCVRNIFTCVHSQAYFSKGKCKVVPVLKASSHEDVLETSALRIFNVGCRWEVTSFTFRPLCYGESVPKVSYRKQEVSPWKSPPPHSTVLPLTTSFTPFSQDIPTEREAAWAKGSVRMWWLLHRSMYVPGMNISFGCDYFIYCVSCTVVVLTSFAMCGWVHVGGVDNCVGCFGNMCTCNYRVLYCLYLLIPWSRVLLEKLTSKLRS
jgi:hypothetical protein